ncbi:protease complex subunit PrcB family protein [Thermosipho ferrireducens]|uniref:Protease complex subunit PrcB family protein n=1 Tax=Thermosipho ferrireducens TaxID=2571116 RepID=A0ABX7S5T0_9BACT|nr:protease complex subunit PrcB family protein [Thermosipho ferrireducens]QTA37193.1 protease complex subunit PrcB family protein [Thermosipho ferrireducens]
MKKMLILFFIMVVVKFFGGFIYIHPVETKLPDQIFTTTNTKFFSIAYVELYNDGREKAYILKGAFSATSMGMKKNSINIFVKEKETVYTYTVLLERKGERYYIPEHLLIAPSNSRIFIENFELKFNKQRENFDEMKIPKLRVKEKGIYTFVLYKGQFLVKDSFSVQEDVFLHISAGERKTGGYSIEIVEMKISNYIITVKGNFVIPDKNAMVTQAFSYPGVTLKLGKLSPGIYKIIVDIKGLGKFTKQISVK